MRVVVDSELVVLLGIGGPCIVRFDTVVAIEPEAVRRENAAAVGRVLLDSVLRRALDETAERLNRHVALIVGVIFLRERSGRNQCNAHRDPNQVHIHSFFSLSASPMNSAMSKDTQ